MNPIKRLRDAIFGAPAALRNKPGGMAIVHGFTERDTTELNGCIVTTVKADSRGFWAIEPTLQMVTRHKRESISGSVAQPGDCVEIVSISDEHLRPLKDPGQNARTEERTFQPPVPTREKETA